MQQLVADDSILGQYVDCPACGKRFRMEARSASGGGYYTVRRGDTLYKIASKHGISVSTLKKRNGLKNDKIHEGQKLKVK